MLFQSIDVINIVGSILDWLNIQEIVTDTAKDVPYLLLVLVLGSNDHLLIEVIDTDDITNHVLKSSLEPVNP